MSEHTPTKSPPRRRATPTKIAGHHLLRPLEGSHATWEVPSDDPKRIELLVLGRARKGDEPEVRMAFDRRLRARASLRHPHLASVVDGGESPRGPYVVISLPRSQPLSAIIAEGPLDGVRTYGLLAGIADALDAAHARWLIHTDLTPRAVFVEPGGSDWAFLTDFGIVHNRAPMAFARAGYRSPEELRGQSPVPESNVYSLACIVYACLTGTAPFGRKSSRAAVQAQLHEPPPRLTEARPDLPKLLDIILNSALSESPDKRPKSAGALMQEVGQALGVVERPSSAPTRSGRFRRRGTEAPAAPAEDGLWSTRSSATAITTDRTRRPQSSTVAGAAAPAVRPPEPASPPERAGAPERTSASPGKPRAEAPATRRARPPKDAARTASTRTKRRGARPAVLGAVLIAAIAGAGVAGWTAGSADTTAKPDPGVVAAQRSAAAKARAATAQERERIAWLGSANDSIERLDARRATYRHRLARATRRGDQAAAARGLASSFARGRSLVEGAPDNVPGAAVLGSALRRAEAAYTRLGKAARNGNRSAYRRAAGSVRAAERAVDSALKRLGEPPA